MTDNEIRDTEQRAEDSERAVGDPPHASFDQVVWWQGDENIGDQDGGKDH